MSDEVCVSIDVPHLPAGRFESRDCLGGFRSSNPRHPNTSCCTLVGFNAGGWGCLL